MFELSVAGDANTEGEGAEDFTIGFVVSTTEGLTWLVSGFATCCESLAPFPFYGERSVLPLVGTAV